MVGSPTKPVQANLAEPVLYQVCLPLAPVHKSPDPASPLDTQIVFGGGFMVTEIKDGWAWGQEVKESESREGEARGDNDGYIGYVPLIALIPHRFASTHCICVLRAPIFTKPHLKSAIRQYLSLNAHVRVDGEDGDYRHVLDLGWVHKNHLMPIASLDGDFVEIAELHFGLPYVWGGISSDGLDCSGLVQTALRAIGRDAPRDAYRQETVLGVSVEIREDLSGLRRGDLIFWKGHVGIMGDADMLLHANAYHMGVAIEPLRQAVDRIAQSAGPITSIKRMN